MYGTKEKKLNEPSYLIKDILFEWFFPFFFELLINVNNKQNKKKTEKLNDIYAQLHPSHTDLHNRITHYNASTQFSLIYLVFTFRNEMNKLSRTLFNHTFIVQTHIIFTNDETLIDEMIYITSIIIGGYGVPIFLRSNK